MSEVAVVAPDGRRLSVGVRISVGAAQDLASTVESMQPLARSKGHEIRWLSPASYHVNLHYLGWAHTEIDSALRTTLADAARDAKPFEFSMKGLGAFPSTQKAKVLWAAVSRGKDELSALTERIETATTDLGFAAADKRRSPYVTFARTDKSIDASGLLLPFSDDNVRKTQVTRIALFDTSSNGDGLTTVAEWTLGAS